MKPQVTIGVCVRNNAGTIREAIESIIGQDFPHEQVELIIVDGNSQDDTLAFARELFENANLKSKIFSENKGLGYARQTVVDNADGKYIVWIDGDMVITQDYVSKLFYFMEKHPEAGVVKGKQALKSGGNLLATLELYSRVADHMTDYTSRKAFYKVLGTSGCIYRTEAIRQAGGFDKDIRGYGEDWDAEIRLRAAGWCLGTLDVQFSDYERNRLTWKSLWIRYWLRGYYAYYFLQKHPGFIKHYRMFPPAAFVNGLLKSQTLFSLTHQKKVFLLPFQHFLKVSAWYCGFISAR